MLIIIHGTHIFIDCKRKMKNKKKMKRKCEICRLRISVNQIEYCRRIIFVNRQKHHSNLFFFFDDKSTYEKYLFFVRDFWHICHFKCRFIFLLLCVQKSGTFYAISAKKFWKTWLLMLWTRVGGSDSQKKINLIQLYTLLLKWIVFQVECSFARVNS